MSAELIVASSPLRFEDADRFVIDIGQTVEAMVIANVSEGKYQRAENQPIDIIFNGELLPPGEWHLTQIKEGDQVVALPRCGYEVIIYIIILIIAVYYVSTIDTDIPSEDQLEQSPSYEANPQGNRARLGQPVPVHFGLFHTYPDYGSYPFHEAVGNEEWGYYLYIIGKGSFDLSDMRFGDTAAENFEGFEFQQYEPGQRVTLIPTAAYSAPEVSGGGLTLFAPNESEFAGASGPHFANAADTQAYTLLFDFICPQGLARQNKKGGLDAVSVTVRVEWREVDSDGNAIGAWSSQNYTYSNATIDVLRFTESIDVAPGRYQVTAQRTNSSSDSFKERDEIRWSGLRSYLENDQVFDETVVAVKVKVTAQLSAQAERKFNLWAQARLPVWDIATQAWLPSAPTRNPIWAFCEAVKSSGYTDANFRDLDKLAGLAAIYDQRGDTFDGRFEQRTDLWSALRRILRVGRARPTNYGDNFDVVRDGPEQRGEYQFTGRNTVKGSFALQFKTMDQWQDHSVIVEYTNPQTKQKEEILCVLPGQESRNPERIGLLDTINRQQAHREGMFVVAKNAYRNVIANLSTELDGRVPKLYDRALVSCVLPRWGSSGDLIGRQGQELVLSENLNWQDNAQHYIWLAMDDGSNSESFEVNRVFDVDNNVVANRCLAVEALPDWIYTGYRKNKTRYAFAAGGDQPRRMILTAAEPGSDFRVSLTFEKDDPRVHQFDEQIDSGIIPLPPAATPTAPVDLTIRGVQIIHGGTVDQPELLAVWTPVDEAQRYFVGVRRDEVSDWQRVYDGVEPHARFSLAAGDTYVRIAAMYETVGPWYETGLIDIGGQFDTPLTPSGLQLAEPFTGSVLSLQWQDDVRAANYRVDYGNGSQVLYSQTVEQANAQLTSDIALLNGLSRTITVEVYAVNANGVASAVPASIIATNPQVALPQGISSFINVNMMHINFDLPAESDFAGVIAWVGPPGFDTATAFRVKQSDPTKTSIDIAIINPAWTAVRIAAFDIWGEDDLNISPQILDVAAGLRASDLHQTLSERINLIDGTGGLLERMGLQESSSENLQQQIDSLQVSSDVPIYIQPDEPQGAIQENSRWFDSDDGNRPYVYSGGVWVDVTDQRILLNSAAVQSESVVRAEQDEVLAGQVNTIQATFDNRVGAVEQSLTAVADDVDGIRLEHYVKLDNDGYVTGFGQFNNGPGASGFIFRADSFGISHPSTPDAYPFVFDASSGQLYVQSAYIPDLDVSKIIGDTASFINANIANGSIDNAKIGNEIRSNNYSSTDGWLINKNGSAVFRNVYVRGNIEATSLNAATGTFSGTLTAQAINAVDTINIAGNSIILKEVFQSASVLNASSNTFSRSINMSGTKGLNGVRIEFSVGFFGGVNGGEPQVAAGSIGVAVSISRDGVLLHTVSSGDFAFAPSSSGAAASGRGFFAGSYVDFNAPSANNSYSVSVSVYINNTGTGSITSRRINYRQISLEGVKV